MKCRAFPVISIKGTTKQHVASAKSSLSLYTGGRKEGARKGGKQGGRERGKERGKEGGKERGKERGKEGQTHVRTDRLRKE